VWGNAAARRLLGIDRRRDRGRLLDSCFADPRYAAWVGGRPEEEPLNDLAAPTQPDVRLSLKLISYARDQQLLVARDITQLMRLEQVRRDFVANVSHELRTPLTVIHGYLELFEPEEAPNWAPRVAEMRAQSQRMLQLVEDLLTLSRLESQHELQRERIGMRSLLSTLKREAEALSQGRHTIQLEPRSEAELLGSPKELHSAFSNLVSNAVRYTPAGGRITIGWADCADGACFSVSDTGYGIPAEHLPRITERFYRVSTSRSRETGGTGLGLAIVRHVLARLGARLEIESAVGKGSTFTCHFDPASIK
jgi:two-component system phosphate regulon sensor histidine kinase PhoR